MNQEIMLFTDIFITENDINIRVCRQVDRGELEEEEELPHLYECLVAHPGQFGQFGQIYEFHVDEDPRVLKRWDERSGKWTRVLARRFRRIR